MSTYGGIDLGGTKIQAVVVDEDYNALGSARRADPDERRAGGRRGRDGDGAEGRGGGRGGRSGGAGGHRRGIAGDD